MLRKSLKRLVLLGGGILFLIAIALIYREASKTKRLLISSASNIINEVANTQSALISRKLTEDLSITQTMANSLAAISNLSEQERRSQEKLLMTAVLNQHKEYDAVFLSWRLNLVNPKWKKPYGRQRVNYYYNNGLINESINLTDTTLRETYEGIYYKTQETGNLILSDPYEFKHYANESEEMLFAISPCAPIYYNGNFQGVIGIDIQLDFYQKLTELSLFPRMEAYIISSNGTIVAHSNTELIKQSIDSIGLGQRLGKAPSEVDNGFTSGIIYDSLKGENCYMAVASIPTTPDGPPWKFVVSVPMKEITAPIFNEILEQSIIAVLLTVLLCIVFLIVTNKVSQALVKANDQLSRLAKGDLREENRIQLNRLDALLEISEGINQLHTIMIDRAHEATNIGKGNLSDQINLLGEHDALGQALEQTRCNLLNILNETKSVVLRASKDGDWTAQLRISGESEGVWVEFNERLNELIVSVAEPIYWLNQLAASISEGDLTARFDYQGSGDIADLRRNLNEGLENLNNLLRQVVESAGFMDKSAMEMRGVNTDMVMSSKEIANAVHEISMGAQTQLSKIDGAYKIIEGIIKTVDVSAGQSEKIRRSAVELLEGSDETLLKSKQSNTSAGELIEKSENTSTLLKKLIDRTKLVSGALNVITEISDQTNLLALNAAIEASKAGESGRGFSVISEEIRKLAELSRKSANEIGMLLNDIDQDTQAILGAMGVMKSEMEHSTTITEGTVEFLENLRTTISRNHEDALDIHANTQNLKSQIKQIAEIAEGVLVISEQTAAGSGQVAASAQTLSDGMDNYSELLENLSQLSSDLHLSLYRFNLEGSTNPDPQDEKLSA
jgi:methyl-accepting chemotaxis protein